MATVTASKKKLVYKQGPDGVFRLKKVDGKDSEAEGKKGVNDYLDELIGCAYEVKLDMDKPPAPAAAADPTSRKLPPLQTRHTSPANPTTGPLSAKKLTSRRTPLPTSSSHSVEPIETTPSAFHYESMLGLRFHIPSFVLGGASSVVLVAAWPLLLRYATIVFGFAKLGLLWGVLLGAISWYCGLIKIQDASTIRQLVDNFVARFRPLPVVVQTVEVPEYDSDDLVSVDSDMNGDDISAHIPGPPSPPKQVRRNTLTRVTPFKYSSPREKYSSNPELPEKKSTPKLTRGFTTDPRYQRRGSGGGISAKSRRNSSQSLDLIRPRTNNSQDLIESGNYKYKNLPSVSDDLPFINEVKLMSNEDMANGPGGVRRLDTMVSKKSILGTTANYSKFLANVQDDDYD